MRKFLLASSALLLAVLLGATAWIARVSPDYHAALMQQIAQSGLAVEQHADYRGGLLQAHSSGRLQLADSYCPGCGVVDYAGTVYHGLGSVLHGHAAWASAEYALKWPDLPLDPALPPLTLRAQQALADGFEPALKAQLSLARSQHTISTQAHDYQLQNGGLEGEIQPGRLALHSPGLSLARDGTPWLELQALTLQAAAGEKLMVSGQAPSIQLPLWNWQGQKLKLDYLQQGGSKKLDIDLQLAVDGGRLGQSTHDKSKAELSVQRLNLDATRAFARELPRLLSPQTTGAARMLGLFSLYSVHGPGFFAPHPALHLQGQDIPLPQGLMSLDIKLAVTEQTRRPPMHPLEWQRALQGRIEIKAPPQHLASGWHWAAQFVNYVTGLPRDYAQLKQQGWVTTMDDGRDHLLIVLDPLTGPRQELSPS